MIWLVKAFLLTNIMLKQLLLVKQHTVFTFISLWGWGSVHKMWFWSSELYCFCILFLCKVFFWFAKTSGHVATSPPQCLCTLVSLLFYSTMQPIQEQWGSCFLSRTLVSTGLLGQIFSWTFHCVFCPQWIQLQHDSGDYSVHFLNTSFISWLNLITFS